MMTDHLFDLCVVGSGLVGSAAGKYASQWGSVCLIGPEEPSKKDITDTRDIYSSHYDEGRQTRCTFTDPVWSHLALKSVSRFRDLEESTGIPVYEEVGFLVIGTRNSDYINKTQRIALADKIGSQYLTNESLKEHFPIFNVSKEDDAVYERNNAGHFSPRRLIRAQKRQAKQNGCQIVQETVNRVSRLTKNGEYCMCVTTDKGKQILTRRVLLTTGAFTGFRNLLPRGLELDITIFPLTVAKVEISTKNARELRSMPCAVYNGQGADDWCKEFPREANGIVRWYLLPPVKYPDGKYYIKLGHFHSTILKRFTRKDEVKRWCCVGDGDSTLVDVTAKLITNIVKDVKPLSFHGDWCVDTETPTEKPYIDMIHSQLGVAIGGNGYAAKSSDEIGRIAAVMIMKNKWDTPLSKDIFRMQTLPTIFIYSKCRSQSMKLQ